MRCLAFAAALLVAGANLAPFAADAAAQAPTITTISPQAVQPAQTTDVIIRGGNLAGATRVWTSFPTEAALAPDVENNGQNAAEVTFRLKAPADAPVGIHGFRVVTPTGVSPMKLIAVDDLPSVAGANTNKSPETAQPLSLPAAVDGYVDGLSFHYFKFPAQAGQRVSFEVLARRMGSPLDPIIRILDSAGRELAWSDDEPGLMADAQLSHTFEHAGEYLIELRDIQYRGGANYTYRLRIGDFPCVTVPYPMGAQRGSDVALSFAGGDMEGIEPLSLKVPDDPGLRAVTVGARRAGGSSSGFVTLAIGDAEEFLESEPNDAAEAANRVPLGATLNGRLDQPDDIDRFIFSATKGQAFTFTGVTRQCGSPADLQMRLLKADGGQVATVDDTGNAEGVLNAAIPDDGEYTLLVDDLANRGGSRYAYRIEVAPTTPGFSLAAAADALNVPAGGTLEVKVTAARQNYGGSIAVAAVNLPSGITSTPTVLGPGQNAVGLTLTAAADAAAGQLGEVQIVGTAKIGEAEVREVASVSEPIEAANAAMPWAPRHLITATAAALAPKPPFSLRVESPQVVFGKNLKAQLKVIAERGAGIDEEIALALPDAKATGLKLPDNVAAALKPIAKGQNEVVIEFSANDKAALGEFTANLIATHTKDKAALTQPVPGIGLKLEEPFRLTIDAADAKLKREGKLTVTVKARRNPAFAAPINVTLKNLPAGVSAPAAMIPGDQSEIEIVLAASNEAAVGAIDNLTAQGEAEIDKAKFSGASAAVSLTVEE